MNFLRSLLAHSLAKRLLERIEVKVGAGVSTSAFSDGKTEMERENVLVALRDVLKFSKTTAVEKNIAAECRH